VINMAGAEQGTAAGLATGTLGNPIFDAIGGTPAVVSTSPRSGGWCYEMSASAAAEYVQWNTTASVGTSSAFLVTRFCLYFPSSLPGADVDLAYISVSRGWPGGWATR
jgi:hypothetical protein